MNSILFLFVDVDVKMLELNGSGEDERMFPVQKGGGQQVYDDIEEDGEDSLLTKSRCSLTNLQIQYPR